MEKDVESNISVYREVCDSLDEERIMMMSPLKLAYIGDSIYELMVRSLVINSGEQLNKLHKLKVDYVNARAQSDFLHAIESELDEDELDIIRRARNAKVNSIPKNQSVHDYKIATSFEALLGYLYLMKREDRIKELFDIGMRCRGES